MSVRQYIGARYVPKFSDFNGGVWSDTTSYEPLTIVKYGNDYYTSKKPVPVGISISNTEYWVLTGNYNGAIGGLEERVEDLENKVEHITDRKYLLIGDSYGNVHNGWPSYFASALGLTSDDCIKVCHGGAAFADSSNSYLSHLMADCPSDNDVTDIVIAGGSNDRTFTVSQVKTAMTTMNTYIRTNFPNVKRIYCAMIGARVDSWSTYKSINDVSYRGYREGARDCNWQFIKNAPYVALNPALWNIGVDEVHPNADGIAEIGKFLATAMEDIDAGVEFSYTSTITYNSNYANSQNDIELSVHVHDGMINVSNQANNRVRQEVINNEAHSMGTLNNYIYWCGGFLCPYVFIFGETYGAKLRILGFDLQMQWLKSNAEAQVQHNLQGFNLTVPCYSR